MKIKKIVALATGTLTLGAVSTDAAANELFTVDHLGSGSEIRSSLIELNSNFVAENKMVSNLNLELKCGEGKCGEGKCGEKKSDKSDKKEDSKKEADVKGKDDKAKEGKCGEGKCGEGKCGEGKCGEGKSKK